MSWSDFVVINIEKHLRLLGLPRAAATHYAAIGGDYYLEQIGNSQNPFKETLDYVGKLAEQNVKGFKYTPPKTARRYRSKRPPELFDFGDMS
ncbi:hypothetical protein [Thaumasiovibrio subtropicus]|uniref:hypothetical protein n=1 Tax=Thaumasiovibrio subtropicus TaxID=1891207 RepID=UPI000B35E1F4|nr:hypothetical protein [Thaumasiovibrio subtropicus]